MSYSCRALLFEHAAAPQRIQSVLPVSRSTLQEMREL